MMDVNRVISTLEHSYVAKLLKQGKRVDGRGLFDYREIKIEFYPGQRPDRRRLGSAPTTTPAIDRMRVLLIT